MLCTVQRFLDRYGADEADGEKIRLLLESTSRLLAAAAGRLWKGLACLEKAERVHYFSVDEDGCSALWLPAWPIVSVREILEALGEEWSAATALTVGDDYQVDAGSGRLDHTGYWLRGARSVRVTYTAGYTPPSTFDVDGYLPTADWASGSSYTTGQIVGFGGGEVWQCIANATALMTPPPNDSTHWTLRDVLLPDDIIEACLQQAGFTWQRRGDLGVSGRGVQGGSFSSYAEDKLLPGVREIMRAYRRPLA